MIKSLLGEDETTENEEELDNNKERSSSSSVSSILPAEEIESVEEIKAAILAGPEPASNTKVESSVEPFEVDRPIGTPKTEKTEQPLTTNSESVIPENDVLFQKAERLEEEITAIENELGAEAAEQKGAVLTLDDQKPKANKKSGGSLDSLEIDKTHISQKPFTPETAGETARKSGLAFSAGVSLFASVVFMMALGWIVDLYLGSSPWGIVGGITIGAIIGFVQFFRTTRQILNPSSEFDKTSLFSDENRRDS